MSLWQKVKGLFTGGAKSGQGLPLKKTKKEKRKDVGHTVGMFLLIFVALVMVSEVTLAIINLFFWDSQSVGSFVVPIAIMPVIALALTGIIIWLNNESTKMAGKVVEPGLTTIRFYQRQVGQEAARMLLQSLEHTEPDAAPVRQTTLGYTLPRRWTSKIGFKAARVSASVDNLCIFTHLKGMDPQYSLTGGTSYAYAPTRTVSFNLDLKF